MEGRLLHTVTLRDREIRKTTLRIEEAGVVARLRTPDIGAKEQVQPRTSARKVKPRISVRKSRSVEPRTSASRSGRAPDIGAKEQFHNLTKTRTLTCRVRVERHLR